MVRVFAQMIELRFFYIILLAFAKILWFLAPYIEKLSGLDEFRDKVKVDLLEEIRNNGKNYE